MKCSRCFSTKLISDRSLGGRLVCARCGSSNFVKNSFVFGSNSLYLGLLISTIIIILIFK